MSLQKLVDYLARHSKSSSRARRASRRLPNCEQLEARLLLSIDAVQVRDINAQTAVASSNPAGFANINGTLFFSANDGINGYELWKSDGTSGGTVMVKDIDPGSDGSNPFYLTNVNGMLFFRASDGVAGLELWKSDGTAEGTVMVQDILAGPNGSVPRNLTEVNGTLYFSATDGIASYELWKSDGTAAGTVRVKDIVPGQNSSVPSSLTNVNGTLFFSAYDDAGGRELWKSDGTLDGTMQVRDIAAGTDNSMPHYLTNVNGTLFFIADDGIDGYELWKSDGTSAGTVQVKDINDGSGSSYPKSLTSVNGQVYFSASDSTSGNELWKSDGTAEGTVQVKDIFAGQGFSDPQSLTNVNGLLYFSATNGIDGVELWKSDGTAGGTVEVRNIFTGATGSNSRNLTNVGGILYFSASDGISGEELWSSDGTTAGTKLIRDIAPGGSSNPRYLTNVNGRLFFSAQTAAAGRELWDVEDVVLAPTDIALSNSSVVENQPAGTVVGTLTTIDPDPGTTFDYSLVSGLGGDDNASFTIVGDVLQTSAVLNFELQSNYSIRIRTTDVDGLSFEKTFSVQVTPVNRAPTDILLTSSSIAENNVANAAVGTLSAADPDSGNTFSFGLVTGPGSTDNGSFSIIGNTLKIVPSTNFESKNTYALRIQVMDQGGLTFEKPITINVTDVNEVPVVAANQSFSIAENSAAGVIVGTVSASDPEGGNISFTILSGSPSNPFTINSTTGQITVSSPAPVLDFETTPSFTLQVKVTDGSNLSTTQAVTVTLTNISEPPIIGGGSGTVTFTKKQAAAKLMPNITVTAPDGANSLGRVEISYFIPKNGVVTDVKFGSASALGTLVASGPTSFKKAGGTHKLTITLNNGVTAADVQNFLRGFTFSTKQFDSAKTTLGRKIDVQAFDRQGTASNLVSTQIRAKTK